MQTLHSLHPGGGFRDVVEVLTACAQPCRDGFRCEATSTCWRSEVEYCKHCLGGTNEACGCYVDGERAADGTECTFAVATDIRDVGVCQAGACVLE